MFPNNWIYRAADRKFVDKSGVAIANPLQLTPMEIEEADPIITEDSTQPIPDKPHQESKETEETSTNTKDEPFSAT